MSYIPKVDRSELSAVIQFLEEVRQDGVEALDPEKVRLVIAVALDLKDPYTPMGTRMHDSFVRHQTNITVEGVCFRVNSKSGQVEVFLQRRSERDKYYAGQYAGLGQTLRVSDQGPKDALKRLEQLEFGVPVRFEFVQDVYVPFVIRGWFECKLYLVFPDQEPPQAEWFPAEPLPPDSEQFKVVRSHREVIIPVALRAFKEKIQIT